MAATAKMNLEYAVRWGLICLILVAGGLFFLYDGAVRYPQHNAEFATLRQQLEGYRLKPELFKAELAKAVSARWRKEHFDPDQKEIHTPGDIRTQFVMAVLFLVPGILVTVAYVRGTRRRFSADEAGLHGFLPEAVPYASILAVNRDKWDAKGIAYVTAATASGEKRLTLDDWKFRGMEAILAEIDAHRPELAPPKPPAPEAPAGEPPPVEADQAAPPTE
jgi:hypothetical protein